jgi:hypothetical protein
MIDFVKDHWKAILGSIATFIFGVFLNDYIDFAGTRRELIAKELDQTLQLSREVNDLLRAFSEEALGRGGNPSKEDVARFENKVTELFSTARALAARDRDFGPAYEKFESALIKLQKTAVVVDGPLTARPFVEAVSEYDAAGEAFRDVVVAEQTSYFR